MWIFEMFGRAAVILVESIVGEISPREVLTLIVLGTLWHLFHLTTTAMRRETARASDLALLISSLLAAGVLIAVYAWATLYML